MQSTPLSGRRSCGARGTCASLPLSSPLHPVSPPTHGPHRLYSSPSSSSAYPTAYRTPLSHRTPLPLCNLPPTRPFPNVFLPSSFLTRRSSLSACPPLPQLPSSPSLINLPSLSPRSSAPSIPIIFPPPYTPLHTSTHFSAPSPRRIAHPIAFHTSHRFLIRPPHHSASSQTRSRMHHGGGWRHAFAPSRRRRSCRSHAKLGQSCCYIHLHRHPRPPIQISIVPPFKTFCTSSQTPLCPYVSFACYRLVPTNYQSSIISIISTAFQINSIHSPIQDQFHASSTTTTTTSSLTTFPSSNASNPIQSLIPFSQIPSDPRSQIQAAC